MANMKPTSSPKKIWRDIKYLSDGYKYNKIDVNQSSQGPIYNLQLIAENFAQTGSNDSHNSNSTLTLKPYQVKLFATHITTHSHVLKLH